MKIEIESIPHAHQRNPNGVGDYWRAADGAVFIRVTKFPDWRYETLVAIHELIEEAVTRHRGIAEPDIQAFDLAHPELDDPGMDPRAPYHREHLLADAIERLVAQALDVDWETYGKACEDAIAPDAVIVTLKKPLSDKGCVWEEQLLERGFDKLPLDQQFGEVVQDGKVPVMVRWPALDFVGGPIYPHEVLLSSHAWARYLDRTRKRAQDSSPPTPPP